MQNTLIVFKYGGNAMVDKDLKKTTLHNICELKKQGHNVMIVHGGGPYIKEALENANIESEFVAGHRKTTPEAIRHVEMALKGRVNGELVSIINSAGQNAVGLSGKDGNTVIAEQKFHQTKVNGETRSIDLGRVGNVKEVDTKLPKLLLKEDYIPVITCVANDENGKDFNINADIFAGTLAGKMKADKFVVLTDVDGLMSDINDPTSILRKITEQEIPLLIDKEIIKGGMLPKTDACVEALKNGVDSSMIINGTKPEQIVQLMNSKDEIGTKIVK
ncbi:MAG: acetylglutamate kinase [Flavobacteriales bacterium]